MLNVGAPSWIVATLLVGVWSLGAAAQVRTSDPMQANAFSLEGEIVAGSVRLAGEDFPIVAGSLDVQARVARLSPEVGLEVDGGLRFGYLEPESFSTAGDPPWASMWLGVAIAHRTPTLTVRGGLGLAPPLRTAVTPHIEEWQLASSWGNWDQWLVVEQVVPFGLRGLVESRLGDVDVGGDAALILGPCLGDENPGGSIAFGARDSSSGARSVRGSADISATSSPWACACREWPRCFMARPRRSS